ncbi:MAG: GxxExxY protein [Chloroflexi bacterium]|nr:MAG: GxxExxY protein [Chloroflexota bacterium]
MGLLFEEESYELRGCVFEVRKKLGTGWPEEAYHQALACALKEMNVPVKSKLRCPMFQHRRELHVFELVYKLA